MTILKENLIAALATAIKHQRAYERSELKFGWDSGTVAGRVEVKEALEKGEHVEIK